MFTLHAKHKSCGTLENIGYSAATIRYTISKDQAAHAEKNLLIFVKNFTQDLCNIQKFFKKEITK